MSERDGSRLSPVAITGGTKGIGRATAEALAQDGHPIALCSRSGAEAKAVAAELNSRFGVVTLGVEADVCSSDQISTFAAATEEAMGPVRVLVTCAGILGPVGSIDVLGSPEWQETIEINVVGVAKTVAAFAPQMARARDGRVVNLSGGGVGGPNLVHRTSAYVTSKFAIAGLTETLAMELAMIGATVNAIAPGPIPTTFMANVRRAGPVAAGPGLFEEIVALSNKEIGDSIEPFLGLLRYLMSLDSGNVSGRVLSAMWDSPDRLRRGDFGVRDDSTFRLRRIDDSLYGALS